MRKSKEETIELEPITRENIDKYCAAAQGVVGDLREMLHQHYHDLTHYHGGSPISAATAPTKAAEDPPYAAKVHRMIVACDGFSTAVRGVY
jgi:hypothetical protein